MHEGRDHPACAGPANRSAGACPGPEANPGGPQAGRQAHGIGGEPPPVARSRSPGTAPVARDPKGAASLRRRPARAQARGITPCRTSCPGRRWRRRASRGAGTLAGTARRRTRRSRTRREEAPRPSPRSHPLRGGLHLRGASLASEATVVPRLGLRAHGTCPDSCQVQARVMVGPGLPVPAMPVPGLCGPRRCRRAPACSLHPRVSSGGYTVVVCATSAPPLAGRGTVPPSRVTGGLRGPDASSPTSTAPEVSPMQPVPTAPRGDRSQPARRVPHVRCCARVEPPPAPCASRPRPSGWSNIRPDRRVRSPAPFVARGCSRAGPGRSPCMARHPQATGDQEGRALPRPLPDVAASPRQNPQPATSRPPVRKLHPLPTPTCAGRPHPTGLPREDEEGKGAPAPSPAPAEGAAPLARSETGQPGERVMGAARVAGFRSTSGSRVSGETVAWEACLSSPVAAADASPGGPGSTVRRPPRCVQRRCEHPGDPGRPCTLRCRGVRPVPRAEE